MVPGVVSHITIQLSKV